MDPPADPLSSILPQAVDGTSVPSEPQEEKMVLDDPQDELQKYRELDESLDASRYSDERHSAEDEIGDLENEDLYCLCRMPATQDRLMIGCDKCDEWYHVDCVGLSETRANRIKQYICPLCQPVEPPPKVRNAKPPPKKPAKKKVEMRTRASRGAQIAKEKCLHCRKQARIGSKYCSHECGIAFSTEKLERLEQEETQRNEAKQHEELEKKFEIVMKMIKEDKPMSLAEKEDLLAMEETAKERQALKEQVAETEVLKKELQTHLSNARKDFSKEKGDKKKTKPKNWDTIDCFGCGQSFQTHKWPKHVSTCYAKLEMEPVTATYATDLDDGTQVVHCDFLDPNTKTYCKKLKAACPRHSGYVSYRNKRTEPEPELCGYPTREGGALCSASRRECLKHQDWENLRNASLALDEINQQQTERSIAYDERIVMQRMASRRGLDPPEPEPVVKPPTPEVKQTELESQEQPIQIEQIEQPIQTEPVPQTVLAPPTDQSNNFEETPMDES